MDDFLESLVIGLRSRHNDFQLECTSVQHFFLSSFPSLPPCLQDLEMGVNCDPAVGHQNILGNPSARISRTIGTGTYLRTSTESNN